MLRVNVTRLCCKKILHIFQKSHLHMFHENIARMNPRLHCKKMLEEHVGKTLHESIARKFKFTSSLHSVHFMIIFPESISLYKRGILKCVAHKPITINISSLSVNTMINYPQKKYSMWHQWCHKNVSSSIFYKIINRKTWLLLISLRHKEVSSVTNMEVS